MTVEKIEAYRTTDGQIFVDRAEAETVQKELSLHDKIKSMLFDGYFYSPETTDDVTEIIVDNIEEIVKVYNETR